MFGYVRPLREEMKVRDWELWQKNYCGLCRCLGKRYGLLARFLLRYDLTFLYSLLSMGAEQPQSKRCWCPASVICRKNCRAEDSAMQFAADLTIILAWWKLDDERRDGGLLRKLGAAILRLVYRRAYQKAKMLLPEMDALVRTQLAVLNMLEAQQCDSIDRTSDAFAQILKGCADWWEDPTQRRPAQVLFYQVGRYIYLADALDDLSEDCKHNRYNPLQYRFEPEDGRLNPDDQRYLVELMETSIDLAASAFELMNRGKSAAVAENVIYYGLPAVLKLLAEGRFDPRKKQVKT